MKTLILIPTSRMVSVDMQLDAGKVPPVALRLCGRALIDNIVEQHLPVFPDARFLLAIDEGRECIEKIIARSVHKEKLAHVVVDSRQSLGSTILASLKDVDLQSLDKLIIHFGDTLARTEDRADTSALYYYDLRETYRWTSCAMHDGKIVGFTDKQRVDTAGIHHIVIGIFELHKPELFGACLEAAVVRKQDDADPFYNALIEYGKVVPLHGIPVDRWDDFGHLDTYYRARQAQLNTRFFNTLLVDPKRATIRKTSQHTTKFIQEVEWYLKLPVELQPYIPRIFKYSLERGAPFVEMEYYGYPNLGDLYLWGSSDMGMWSYAIDSIFGVIHEMDQHQIEEDPEVLLRSQREMYLDKTIDRCRDMYRNPLLSSLLDRPLIINGKRCEPVSKILNNLEQLLVAAGVLDRSCYSVIHGDMCLSNILYDPKNRITKLIDPRGSFGSHVIYGDRNYDLAKLMHSFRGHYESIVNDEFSLIMEGDSCHFSVDCSPLQRSVSELFIEQMKARYPNATQKVDLIECLLFLSMIPLHADFPHRQLAMLCVALLEFERYERTWGVLEEDSSTIRVAESLSCQDELL